MEVISIIVMFLFGNMNDTEDRMTQYIPMSSISECLKEKRELTRDKEFKKDAFCGEALVEIKDGEVIALHTDAVMIDGDVTVEQMKQWTQKAKEKWNKK